MMYLVKQETNNNKERSAHHTGRSLFCGAMGGNRLKMATDNA